MKEEYKFVGFSSDIELFAEAAWQRKEKGWFSPNGQFSLGSPSLASREDST